MKKFEYANEQISEREIMIAIPSIVIGVGILTLPKDLAAVTIAADGWVSIAVGGIIAIMITWAIAKFTANFPHQPFISFASTIATKPVAIFMTLLFAISALCITSYQVRKIADISKEYLFTRTPVEVIALAFLLVIVYAVSGSRAGIFRLNMMFLPIILIIALLVFVFTLQWFKLGNVLPVFKTSFNGYAKGMGTSVISYMGYGIVLFYTSLVRKPEKVPKKAVMGMCIPIGLYLLLFIVCIGVFGNAVAANLLYPTIELAKQVQIPGEFFERFESIFFVIWIMAIFNTASITLDIAVFTLNSVFKNTKKVKIVFVLSPIIYIIAMFPQELTEVSTFGKVVSSVSVSYMVAVVAFLFILGKIRKVM